MRPDPKLHADGHGPVVDNLQPNLPDDIRALFLRAIDDPIERLLVEAGFADPASAARRLREWQQGTPPAMRGAGEQRAVRSLLPALLDELARFEDPDAALAALDEMICRLPEDISLFVSFVAQPALMTSVLGLLGHAPALSRHLIAQPELIRGLIDGSAHAPLPAAPDLDTGFRTLIDSVEPAAGTVRVAQAVSAYRFGLGLRLLEGGTDALIAAAANCDLAEAALRVIADDVLERIASVHGTVPGADLVILALGGFGGRTLTQSSDLDLVYLFTGDCGAQSDGRKPLDANEYFSRVAQQITMAMSTVTTLGPLYEIDTRLRPWGAKGQLACSTETFERYHGDNAWTWEHMALTRARPVYGSEAGRRMVRTIVNQRLRSPRDRFALLADATKMRGEIAHHKPPKGPFDVKLVEGGMVDLEFVVHVRQLDCHVGLDSRLPRAIRSLVAADLVASELIGAYDVLSRLLIVLRLLSPGGQEPAPEQRATIARACGFADWAALLGSYARARDVVRATWQGIVAEGTVDRD